MDKKNLFLDDLKNDRFVTEEEYAVTKAENEAMRVKYNLEEFLTEYGVTEGADIDVDKIERIADELGCPTHVVGSIMGKETKEETMSENTTITIEPVVEAAPEAPKKRRGRPPGSVNRKKVAAEVDKLAATVAVASSVVEMDVETLMDVARNLKDLASTFEKLATSKTKE